LPQAVANSFLEWTRAMDYDITICHPEGYELSEKYAGGCPVLHSQEEAFQEADFIYTKNWSSYSSYGQILNQDLAWTVNAEKMTLSTNAFFMHCLPVRRNMVVTDAVLDGEKSLILEQARNRTFAAQAVLRELLINIKP
ncbi:MAG: acetylornithine carbamoyltransferase, partial [Bacteroidota bacterium]